MANKLKIRIQGSPIVDLITHENERIAIGYHLTQKTSLHLAFPMYLPCPTVWLNEKFGVKTELELEGIEFS